MPKKNQDCEIRDVIHPCGEPPLWDSGYKDPAYTVASAAGITGVTTYAIRHWFARWSHFQRPESERWQQRLLAFVDILQIQLANELKVRCGVNPAQSEKLAAQLAEWWHRCYWFQQPEKPMIWRGFIGPPIKGMFENVPEERKSQQQPQEQRCHKTAAECDEHLERMRSEILANVHVVIPVGEVANRLLARLQGR